MTGLTTPAAMVTPAAISADSFAERAGLRLFNDPELKKLSASCAEWYSAFLDGQSPRWLTVLGNSGNGKTLVCDWLWREANRRVCTGRTVRKKNASIHVDTNYIPRMIYWPDFIQKMRGGALYDLRNDMKRWPVLFLDEIGGERDINGYAAEELGTLLGMRMGKWTLLTSNRTFESFKTIDQRVASRLIRDQNICVVNKAVDYFSRPEVIAERKAKK